MTPYVNLLLEATLWTALAAAAYSYAVYPLLIWLLARLFGRDWTRPRMDDDQWPRVSLLIAAHNEEQVIAGRIENALAMEYPPHKLEIVVASDGSSDRTVEIARGYQVDNLRVLDYAENRGKAAVLNATAPGLRGEILLFSDANTYFEPSAVKRLAAWFRDPSVGMVCGKLVLVDPRTGANVDSIYWRYETFLKRCEGRLGALLGANGAIYALRRAYFTPIPSQTIVDDFVIPLLAKLRHPFRVHYDAEAVAWEDTPPDIGSEFRRRARIGAGGFQSIVLLRRLLSPRRGWLAFTFFSHKVLRWLGPFFLAAALASNLMLLEKPLHQATLTAQLLFYFISAVGAVAPPRVRLPRVMRLATMFSSMNLALLVGFWRWASGRQRGAWQRTAR